MIELRNAISNELKTVYPRVYYQYAAKDKPFPYLVYNFLPSNMRDAGMEVFVMDVDVWDNDTDTTLLETVSQQVWALFNSYQHLDDMIYFSIHRQSRFPELEDNEPSIRRRKMTFEVRYLYKGGTE